MKKNQCFEFFYINLLIGQEHEILESTGGRDPDIIVKNPSESKGGVAQKLIKVNIRVGPDLVFLAECQISDRIIRHALPDITG